MTTVQLIGLGIFVAAVIVTVVLAKILPPDDEELPDRDDPQTLNTRGPD